jgi:hypothetical protein
MNGTPTMAVPLQRLLDAELQAGNRIVEVSSWPPKCKLLVILEHRFRNVETVSSGVTFHELHGPHYWRAEYRYDDGAEVLACRD